MDQNSPDLLPSVHEPVNAAEYKVAPQESGVQTDLNTEIRANQALEQGASPVDPAMVAPALPPAPYPAPAVPPIPPADSNGSAAAVTAPAITLPPMADDSDLIEKEWVEKAKEIVSKTSQDPYQQNREMTLAKADYLKKRYNREIKISEDK